jgi:hypothetical protein
MLRLALAALFAVWAGAAPASAQQTPAVRWGDILIYQAQILDAVAPSETELAAYAERLEAAATSAFQAQPADISGVLFVAVKPGGRARVWVLGDNGAAPPALRTRLEESLSAIAPLNVRRDFLFGLTFSAGIATPYVAPDPAPIPREWEAQIPPEGVMLDDAFIDRVWP